MERCTWLRTHVPTDARPYGMLTVRLLEREHQPVVRVRVPFDTFFRLVVDEGGFMSGDPIMLELEASPQALYSMTASKMAHPPEGPRG